MSKRIVFVARVRNSADESVSNVGLIALDEKAEKYAYSGLGGRANKTKRIRVSNLIREFKNGDKVKIIMEKVDG